MKNKKAILLILLTLAISSCDKNSSTILSTPVENSSTTSVEVSENISPSSPMISLPSVSESISESSSINSSPSISEPEPIDFLKVTTQQERKNLSIQGYAASGIKDFSIYQDTPYYRVVTNEDEFISAINDAKYEYETVWDEQTSTYTQTLTKEGSVRVIEVANDLNLGYYTLSDNAKKMTQVVSDFASKYSSLKDYLYFSDMFLENGISQIKIERTSNLMIFSKNKAKITHAGFKLTSCDNIVFRNLEFDEIWQWDDAINNTSSKIGDYDWFGWAYFKIGFCGYVWIDHCKFGKSYDGQIDYANANYHATKSTSFRAPYGATGGKGISITWCDFASGSDNQDGYLYKMMKKLEDEYQAGTITALYYKALRDKNISFEDILYGLAIPQKKGFLIGDDQDYKEDDHVEYDYNLELNVTFANCKFTNLEDRIPKVRGGNIYMHNCYVDSSNYFTYRTNLSKQNAQTAVRAINSSWKCALVSQGIVCGQGGSVRADNCVFLGINTLLKNNDSGSIKPYNNGGYELNNCRYACGSVDYTGSSSDSNHQFKNSNTNTLATQFFKWNTIDGSAPYTPEVLIELDSLKQTLENEVYGVGVNEIMNNYWLTFTIN